VVFPVRGAYNILVLFPIREGGVEGGRGGRRGGREEREGEGGREGILKPAGRRIPVLETQVVLEFHQWALRYSKTHYSIHTH
jgi:hypothetical protein